MKSGPYESSKKFPEDEASRLAEVEKFMRNFLRLIKNARRPHGRSRIKLAIDVHGMGGRVFTSPHRNDLAPCFLTAVSTYRPTLQRRKLSGPYACR